MMFKKELLSSRMDYNRLKKDLDNALDDVTSLTTALENNNKMNESILRELEELRSWKTNHLKCHPELEVASKDHQESERTIMPTEAVKPQAKAEDSITDPPTLSRATSLETAVNDLNQAPISVDSLPAMDSVLKSNEDEQSQVTQLEMKLRDAKRMMRCKLCKKTLMQQQRWSHHSNLILSQVAKRLSSSANR